MPSPPHQPPWNAMFSSLDLCKGNKPWPVLKHQSENRVVTKSHTRDIIPGGIYFSVDDFLNPFPFLLNIGPEK